MKKILILIINYKCEQDTLNYVKHLSLQSAADNITISVIDNMHSQNCDIDLSEELKKCNISVDYFDPQNNLGYLNGGLYGIEQFNLKYGYLPDWIVLSNTDIVIPDKNFFLKFLTKNYEKDIWCIGPSIISIDGVYCNPHYTERIPLGKINRIINIFSRPVLARIYAKFSQMKAKETKKIKKSSSYVYSNHGSFMILRKNFYEALNGEKYGVLLYSEESFVAEFILEKNKKSYYDSELELIHNENLTTGKIGVAKCGKYISESTCYIKKRFYEKD